jgi:hypothetical protein
MGILAQALSRHTPAEQGITFRFGQNWLIAH